MTRRITHQDRFPRQPAAIATAGAGASTAALATFWHQICCRPAGSNIKIGSPVTS